MSKDNNKDNAMDKWDFLRWRRTHGFTQEEAGEKLGVARGTIVNWERGTTRIPLVIDLACCELTRRSKHRPDFGPVNLVYSDGQSTTRSSLLRCEVYSNNDTAIKRALTLTLNQSLINPMIIEDGGAVIWTTSELLRECERRRDESRLSRGPIERRGRPKKERSPPADDKAD